MLNKISISVILASSFFCGNGAFAQTLADVAARQRAKALEELHPKIEIPKAVVTVDSKPYSAVKEKRFMVIATYSLDDGNRVLVNDMGNLRPLKIRDHVQGHVIQEINDEGIKILPQCKETRKCKTITVRIGGGI